MNLAGQQPGWVETKNRPGQSQNHLRPGQGTATNEENNAQENSAQQITKPENGNPTTQQSARDSSKGCQSS